jgi:hypothetical protein
LNSSNYKFNNGISWGAPPNGNNGNSLSGTWNNSTVEAVNAATGQMVWSHDIPLEGYRGSLSTSGNLVFVSLSSGDVQMLNAQTGALVRDYYIGGPLNVIASVGATANGQEEVIVPITAGLVTWGSGVPGDLVALTLQNVPAAVTSTTTATVTATSTAVGAGSTVRTTVAGPGSTVTISGTTTVTSSSGVSSTTLYGVAAVAVIFIIATGYVAMRGRKPAS